MKEKLIKLIEVAIESKITRANFTINGDSQTNNIKYYKDTVSGGEIMGQTLNGYLPSLLNIE